MKTIYKYIINVTDEQILTLPAGALLLHVGIQTFGEWRGPSGVLHLWALVDTDAAFVNRRILIKGTGHPADDVTRHQYIGTVLDGPLVWHVFDGYEEAES